MRNTSGFAQKKLRKTLSFHEQKFAKNTTGFAQIAQIAQKKVRKTAQNSLRFMRKNSAKVRKKKICAKIAQILRKKYRHFVETLFLRDFFFQI